MQPQQTRVILHIRRSTASPIHNRSRQYESIKGASNNLLKADKSLQQQRKQLIKGKIKSRIGQIIRNKNSEKVKAPPTDWRRDSDFSVEEIIQKHNMHSLRRKYLEYLERGFQEANHVRIGGAAKLHEPMFCDAAVQSLIVSASHHKNLELDRHQAGKPRPVRHSISKMQSEKNPLDLNLDNILSTCRMSPSRAGKRPFTADYRSEKVPVVGKSFVAIEQAKDMDMVRHVRKYSEDSNGYFFGAHRRTHQAHTLNMPAMQSGQKYARHSLPMRPLNDIQPWDFEEDAHLGDNQ